MIYAYSCIAMLQACRDADQVTKSHRALSAEVASLSRILSYHAHIYYDPVRTRSQAELVRTRIGQRFVVQLGRWHDVPVGPHPAAMYQVAFDVDVFAHFVPWLLMNRLGLDVLVHPNTLAPLADHLNHALWLGTPRTLKDKLLEASISPKMQSPVVPNASPELYLEGLRSTQATQLDAHGWAGSNG